MAQAIIDLPFKNFFADGIDDHLDPTFQPILGSKIQSIPSPPSLLQICCTKVVSDSSLCLAGGLILPKTLLSRLLATAFEADKYLASQTLLPFWPEDTLVLHQVLPHLLSNPKLIGDYEKQRTVTKKAWTAAKVILIKWLQLIVDKLDESSGNAFHKERFSIKTLDISGFPFVLLSFLKLINESTKLKRISLQDQSEVYTLKVSLLNADKDILDSTVNRNKNALIKIEPISIYCKIQAFQKLQPRLIDSTRLVGLDFSRTYLQNDGVINFLPTITSCVNLTCLNLSQNNIQLHRSPEATSSLRHILMNLPKLRRLNLSNNRISGRNGNLASLCGTELLLDYLNLNACGLRETDLQYLPLSLMHLDLSENNIPTLSPHLKEMTRLSILELENCNIEDAALVVNLLLSLPSLSAVNLAYQWWEDDCDEQTLTKLFMSESIHHVVFHKEDIPLLQENLNDVATRKGKTLVWK